MSDAEYVGTTLDCISELEREYLRLGAEDHAFLEDGTQLSAFFLMGIRGTSLLRGMFRLLEPDFLDAYDAIRRAFVEGWQLQYEFRLREGTAKAQKWLNEKGASWKPDFRRLEESNRELGLESGAFEREFFSLAEVAHPTFTAAKNSCAIASASRGLNQNAPLLQQAYLNLTLDFLNLVNRQIWLTIVTADHLLSLNVGRDNLKMCRVFHEAHTSGSSIAARREATP